MLYVSRLRFSLDPLIAEAKRRMWRRRLLVVLLVAAVGAGVGVSLVGRSSPGGSGPSGLPGAGAGAVTRVSAHGIGGVRIGATKSQTVADLSRLFGPPSRRFVSAACGPRYTEVDWGNLYVEFRQNHLSGYRYLSGSWLRSGMYTSSLASAVRPHVSTAAGITIGDTLRQLRSTYGALSYVGTDRWQNSSGLVFYDNAQHDPVPPSSRITEIKYGTCGDF